MTPALLAMALLAAQAAPAGEAPRQHKVTSRRSPAPEPGAENEAIPSLVEGVRSRRDWERRKRPELLRFWTQVLGKLDRAPADQRWFGDVSRVRERTAAKPNTTPGFISKSRWKRISTSATCCWCRKSSRAAARR